MPDGGSEGCCEFGSCFDGDGDGGKNKLHNLPHNVGLLFSSAPPLLVDCLPVLRDALADSDDDDDAVPKVASVFTGRGAGTTSGGKGCPAKSNKGEGFARTRGDARDLCAAVVLLLLLVLLFLLLLWLLLWVWSVWLVMLLMLI